MSDSTSSTTTGGSSTLSPGSFPGVDNDSCELLGPTALVVQAVLGVLVILSLVYKRHRENPMRPWRIWLFDVSKQVVGQLFVHVMNVLISDLISQHTSGNACVFYSLHILIDTTLGVAFIYYFLHFLTYLFSERLHLKGFESGIYGNPPSFNYWARQAALYVLTLITMKLLVTILLILFPGLLDIGEWLLSWTHIGDGESLQVIFTMGIFPITMNILQFWLIDSIVKASSFVPVALDADVSRPGSMDREPLFRAPSDDEDDDSYYNRHDVEQGRLNARSHSPRASDEVSHVKALAASLTAEEHKSNGDSGQAVELHSYPPSLSTSVSSLSSSSNQNGSAPKPAKNLLKKANKRPAPLSIRSSHQPAVNSPDVKLGNNGERSRSMPIIAPVPKVAASEAIRAWEESWDDANDWANRVGEDDWTGRRIEQKRNNLSNAWSENADVGS